MSVIGLMAGMNYRVLSMPSGAALNMIYLDQRDDGSYSFARHFSDKDTIVYCVAEEIEFKGDRIVVSDDSKKVVQRKRKKMSWL